jgi:hypothetical protein
MLGGFMSKQIASVPIGLFVMVLLDITGIFLIEANNSGLAFITLTSAYVFCTTGLYVLYRVLVNAKGW